MDGRRSSTPDRAAMCAALAALVVASGCKDTSHAQAALRVTVGIGPEVKATCVRVWARAKGGEEKLGAAIPVEGRKTLTVAVYRSPELNGTVEVGARGFLGASCDGELMLNEESESASATFVDGQTVPVALELNGVPAAFDADHDGFRGSAFGGADCDDSSSTVHPGAPELCDDRRDNDCNGRQDCEELACNLKGCNDGDPCTTGEVCGGGACLSGSPEQCLTAPDECHQAPGTCSKEKGGCVFKVLADAPCSKGFCTQDGLCADTSTESDCADGLDNDHNGLTDCADPDCDARACAAADPCIVGATCANRQCSGGSPRTCTQTTNPCLDANGSCNASGACVYMPKPVGTPCGSGQECHADGLCGLSETGSLCANGKDDDGDGVADCDDQSCLGQSCSDGDACTTGDYCAAVGQCASSGAVACNAPGVCESAMGAACDQKSGTCVYPKTPDAPCKGGFCSTTGACVAPFPYTPSNFNPLDYAPADRSGPYTFNCGDTIIDTTPGSATPFTNLCGQPAPRVFTVMQANGVEAMVLPMKGLTLSASNTLTVVGSRPLILAVYGDVTINGTINAGANLDRPGAGGNSTACGTGTGNPGTGNGNRGGGGGGGGFGTGGATGGDSPNGGMGGSPGLPNGPASLSPLRGGCKGGQGGNSGGAGGAGGGAIQISAAGMLTVNRIISAQGGGGRGGNGSQSGGGGGGSGGAILLEGNSVAFGSTAVLVATGGGGGEGAGASSTGNDGANGNGISPAPGGANGSNRGGDGGSGAFPGSIAGQGSRGQNIGGAYGGGGGGGGGLGYIRINAANGCTGAANATLRGFTSSTGTNCP